MSYIIDYIEKLDVSDIEICKLLTQVYVDAGYVKPNVAQSIFSASSVKKRGKIIGARDVNTHDYSGMLIVVYPDSTECRFLAEKEVEFHLLAVKAKHRGKGLGKNIVSRAINEVRQEGYSRVLLATQKRMFAAHKLYESLAFVRKENLDFTRSKIDFLAYEKIL